MFKMFIGISKSGRWAKAKARRELIDRCQKFGMQKDSALVVAITNDSRARVVDGHVICSPGSLEAIETTTIAAQLSNFRKEDAEAREAAIKREKMDKANARKRELRRLKKENK